MNAEGVFERTGLTPIRGVHYSTFDSKGQLRSCACLRFALLVEKYGMDYAKERSDCVGNEREFSSFEAGWEGWEIEVNDNEKDYLEGKRLADLYQPETF